MDDGVDDLADAGVGGIDGVDHEVASLLAPLRGLDERSVTEHVAVFEAVHAALREQLAQAPSTLG